VLKHRLTGEGSNETVTKCNQLKLLAEDGKLRDTDCASTESLAVFTKLQLSPFWEQLKLLASDGKYYVSDCSNTKSLFCIIHSSPPKKSSLWLAKVGYKT
jgi:hypothetical protein